MTPKNKTTHRRMKICCWKILSTFDNAGSALANLITMEICCPVAHFRS